MASQYFEFGGIRIDLSKVQTVISLSVTRSGPIQIELTNQIGGSRVVLTYPESGKFADALEAYRESLKPKPKPKPKYPDGWYVVDFKDGATSHLRYFKGDVGYHHDGIRSISNVEYYRNRARTDFQPPPPTITD